MMAFIMDGVKILYRFAYGILKHNKEFIKSLKDPQQVLEKLREQS